jgi:hypothetical protein
VDLLKANEKVGRKRGRREHLERVMCLSCLGCASLS